MAWARSIAARLAAVDVGVDVNPVDISGVRGRLTALPMAIRVLDTPGPIAVSVKDSWESRAGRVAR